MKLYEIVSIGLKLLAFLNLYNLVVYVPLFLMSFLDSPSMTSFIALAPFFIQIAVCVVLFVASNYISQKTTGSWGDREIGSIQDSVNWYAAGISLIAVYYLMQTLLRVVSRIQFDLAVHNDVAPTDPDWPIQSAIRILVCLALLKYAGPVGQYLRNLHDSQVRVPESAEDPAV